MSQSLCAKVRGTVIMRHDFQYRRLRVFTIDSRVRGNDGGLIEGLDSGDVMIRILFGFNGVKIR